MMQLKNSQTSYGAISLFLHWLMAFFVIAMLMIGWGRDYTHGELKSFLMDIHKSTGIMILLLMTCRLVWRLASPPPHLPAEMPKTTKYAAHGAHTALYILMFLMPISGWLLVSAVGRTIDFLGVIPLPSLMEKTQSYAPMIKETHEIMAYGLAGLILLHAAAGIFHHVVHKDDILERMLPVLKKQKKDL